MLEIREQILKNKQWLKRLYDQKSKIKKGDTVLVISGKEKGKPKGG